MKPAASIVLWLKNRLTETNNKLAFQQDQRTITQCNTQLARHLAQSTSQLRHKVSSHSSVLKINRPPSANEPIQTHTKDEECRVRRRQQHPVSMPARQKQLLTPCTQRPLCPTPLHKQSSLYAEADACQILTIIH